MTRNSLADDIMATEEDPPAYTPPENDTCEANSSKTKPSPPANDQPAAPKADKPDPVEKSMDEKPKILAINRNDPPQPGSIYIINESSTSKVITNEGGKVVLTEYNGEPKKSQKWVCQRSGGWLGFTNDAGPDTTYLGHDHRGILICTATWHLPWEHFNVHKREGDGFEFMVRHWFGSLPLGYRDDGANLGKREIPDTWWGFTKIV
ncbi:hypothetical protein TWF569_003911 [Orbilia oligospora]|uniref:Ricin B lectin domain-containing protein n=1 Tax=Orbilia oligospora TaxID=2813651 RepID=A0A8H2E226_ORBOL|nr:hypothetical protein TWF569_003911 [Orbilia oligospora]KAF3188438.1 hypothetical protein TWF225_003412 [Orbilia oligospora]KAF3188439.1 hypothetical protein TWF225_003412 [Orbilia oligospora]KAF3250055.1 hypothetical protein TWF128_007636 [Orbilia oligospora]KAF3250056.1 hypothetical protein TWF128_007636 [Orbilia oligospora]